MYYPVIHFLVQTTIFIPYLGDNKDVSIVICYIYYPIAYILAQTTTLSCLWKDYRSQVDCETTR